MASLDLNTLDWQLIGWRPFSWRLAKRVETQSTATADIGPLPARLHASVQQNLLDAGIIQDWNVGLNSLACEWVEHRHWDFSATLPEGRLPKGETVHLEAPGLDYSGWVLVDCVEAARFEGALLPHCFDLTEQLGDGKAHQISLIFEEPPREQGQIGYTSLSRFFKPRYTYSWDWCPRIVPVGVWEPAALKTGPDALCEVSRVDAALARNNQSGSVSATVHLGEGSGVEEVMLHLCEGEQVMAETAVAVSSGTATLVLENVSVNPWFPNGIGAQPLYEVRVSGRDVSGACIWRDSRMVGFRRVEWQPCEGAPEDAEPWLCVVNDVPVFLQGANWVPPKAVYHDAAREDYEKLIALYKEMGTTMLRVWGGGILEKHDFYDLCDRAGILVWQELPMSSSGVENCPPYEPEAIALLERIAKSYVQRRGHHASLLLWSGGNELTWGGPEDRTGVIPVDYSHPCIGALKTLFEKEDPGRRFIATSPTGPRFCADAQDYGKGIHHDIHGPWGLGGFEGATFEERLKAWRDYWEKDDSLFRSEAGMPGAASPECIARYADTARLWPPTGMYWFHTASWWIQWDLCGPRMSAITDPGTGMETYIQETQKWQAEAYGIAAKACKGRFPRCGGFIIWMGHDCFPCPANNSVIDFLCEPKPAYYALREVFTSLEFLPFSANTVQR